MCLWYGFVWVCGGRVGGYGSMFGCVWVVRLCVGYSKVWVCVWGRVWVCVRVGGWV